MTNSTAENNTTTETFEDIAKDAVATLTTVALTLKITGLDIDLANAIAEDTEALIARAIAIGGV